MGFVLADGTDHHTCKDTSTVAGRGHGTRDEARSDKRMANGTDMHDSIDILDNVTAPWTL